jgi:DNA polymerase-3 subunit gamma/tau
MGQALYRKYRSKTLGQIVGQEHITDTLERALKQGRISHAYLFTGPRGVGKTSIARILAHEINDLPYDDDSSHIDIIEIDAASNRRIDEIRELRDKVYVAPASAKYKVYIIDEVHMLTREAFNALLKTLEEPPAHAVFILATTEAHKLPDTIVSRTQRFTFRPVSLDKVAAHLGEIAKLEKIKIDGEALELLAEYGEGSFRDSISLLDQLGGSGKPIGAAEVRQLLGVPPSGAIDSLLKALAAGDINALVSHLNDLYTGGYRPAGIAAQLAGRLRTQLVEGGLGLSVENALGLLGKLIDVPASHDPERFLEIVLLAALPVETAPAPRPRPAADDAEDTDEPPRPEPPREEKPLPGEPPVPEPSGEPLPDKAAEKPKKPAAGSAAFDESIWPEVLQILKRNHNTLYGVVRMARPEFIKRDGEDVLHLAFAFAFHQKRIKEAANSQKLADVIYGLTGVGVKVECLLDPNAKPPEAAAEAESKGDAGNLDVISNIFGTAEMLES